MTDTKGSLSESLGEALAADLADLVPKVECEGCEKERVKCDHYLCTDDWTHCRKCCATEADPCPCGGIPCDH